MQRLLDRLAAIGGELGGACEAAILAEAERSALLARIDILERVARLLRPLALRNEVQQAMITGASGVDVGSLLEALADLERAPEAPTEPAPGRETVSVPGEVLRRLVEVGELWEMGCESDQLRGCTFEEAQAAVAEAKGLLPADPMCVCGHPKSQHRPRASTNLPPTVLACIAAGCACAPGCIHEGFVDADAAPRPMGPDDPIARETLGLRPRAPSYQPFVTPPGQPCADPLELAPVLAEVGPVGEMVECRDVRDLARVYAGFPARRFPAEAETSAATPAAKSTPPEAMTTRQVVDAHNRGELTLVHGSQNGLPERVVLDCEAPAVATLDGQPLTGHPGHLTGGDPWGLGPGVQGISVVASPAVPPDRVLFVQDGKPVAAAHLAPEQHPAQHPDVHVGGEVGSAIFPDGQRYGGDGR